MRKFLYLSLPLLFLSCDQKNEEDILPPGIEVTEFQTAGDNMYDDSLYIIDSLLNYNN